MAQKRNLNINPYYDDFDPKKNFYKVLFKPGFPVQTRELTTLQSMLQDQIENFGSHVFKEGSVVIPGNISYDNQFYAVKLNPTNFGVEVSLYAKQLIGKIIEGELSGTTARVVFVSLPTENNVDDLTIYVKYIDSNNEFIFDEFGDGEFLTAQENITYGNSVINSGTRFASTISENATSIGSAASIDEGVYFIRGYFVGVQKQTILLDEYENSPSYRVGLKIDELFVNAKQDESLFDNAKGFSNFSAPGADRLQINLTLTKKLISDIDDTDFVELLRLQDGVIRKIQNKTQYNLIKDYLAERTFDESGSYSVDKFNLSIHNSLNDKIGVNGLFFEGQKTEQNNDPSDDLLCVKVSPGKAYVKGYDVEATGTTIVDLEKPRNTIQLKNKNVPFSLGNLIRVNNVSGTPQSGEVVQFHSQLGESGVGIGSGRVYTFNLTDSAYNSNASKWDLYLYDVQTYTVLTINDSLSSSELKPSYYVKGKNSGASGYSVFAGDGTSTTITLRQTSGTFSKGEQLVINGIDFPRTVKKEHSYGPQDIKSISNSGAGSRDFSADAFLENFSLPNDIEIGEINQSAKTLKSPGNVFTGITTDSIIRYQTSSGDETFNRVEAVSDDGLTIDLEPIGSAVAGVYNNAIGADGSYSIKIGAPIIRNPDEGQLYARLPHDNIATVDTNDSNIMIRLQSNDVAAVNGVVTVGLNNFTLPSGISTASFVAFDADRYSLHKNSSGYIGTVTSDTFTLNSTDNTISFSGFTGTETYRVNATVKKPSIRSKTKIYTRSTKILINKSNSGVTTSLSGLVKNDYYGLRVQDEEISLNYPDVVKVLAVFESLDANDPTLDEIEFSSIANVKDNVIIGENIVSSNSNAIARVVEKSSAAHTLGVVYLNSDRFVAGEKVTFEESNIEVNTISINASVTAGKYKDVTGSFSLDKGQREQYYDYSRIVRQQDQPIPSKRLMVIFDHYTVPSTEEGDVFTVSSYNHERFSYDVPQIDNTQVRSTDTLDFRPIVEEIPFSSIVKSPFDFDSRSFSNADNRILAPNEDSLIDYSYYVGRIDKVFIDKHAKIFVKKGTASESPSEPANNTDVMELATIELPPYLYDPKDASLTLVDNRRYTMRDIGKIEDRVDNLEEVTSLSLLELNTQSLQIKDSNGNDRFKSGFFVDDFKNNLLLNSSASSIEVNTDSNELVPIISSNTIKSKIAASSIISDEEADFSTDFNLLDSNVRKSGRAITLNYEEKDWIQQPLATRVENVNPFHVVAYYGTVKLTPESDNWVRTIRLPNRFVNLGTIVQRFGGGLAVRRDVNLTTRDVLVASGDDEFMRSRNTQFSVANVKPLTQMYQFLDGNGSLDIIPKLLEIATDSTLENYGSDGIFEVGEEVKGYFNDSELINFRLATSNHKYGPFNSPTKTFNINPYVKSESIDSDYSQASKVLNVDTFSLCEEAQGKYSGYVAVGMKLVGQSSGAVAYVKNVRLVSDNYGDLIGSFFIRDPYPNNNHVASSSVVKINTGTKTYKITSSPTNATPLKGSKLISFAQTKYKSEGTWQERQRVTTLQVVVTYWDPLAQTFSVGGNVEAPDFTEQTSDEDDDGAFLTSVDLFFGNKPTGNDEVRVEIRTVELGTPTRVVLGSPAVLRPDDITISRTGETATNVVFDEPIYLEGGKEYAIVLVAETTDQYEVWCAQMGEKTVNTQSLPDAEAVRYTKQFALGSLFKSQNGSIWTANQYQDLKFKLYKAKFTSDTGTAFFYNPTLDTSNTYVSTLDANPIQTLPKTMSVGIGTTTDSSTVNILQTVGRKITGSNSSVNGYGYIVGTGSSVMGVTVTDGGSNYVTDTNVETFAITGQGSGLTLNIAQTNGAISGTPTVVNRGNGYQVGDIVGIVTSTVSSLTGRDAVITINDNGGGVDTLFLSGVQGEKGSLNTFEDGDEIKYYDDAGSLQSFVAPAPVIDINRTTENVGINSGNYFRVNHFNHGMYSSSNKVSLSNVQSSYSPTKLNAPLTSTGSSISVADVSDFTTFEGVAVSVDNPGYLKIGGEVVGYTTVTGSTPGNIEFNSALNGGRAIEGVAQPHNLGSLVYKYELNGVSLLRINKTHDISNLDLGPDGYYVAIDRGSGTNIADRSTDGQTLKPQLSFIDNSFVGGLSVNASENILFTEVMPSYDILIPGSETEASASIRTVSGTSVGGSENSFEDLGFENVELNKINKLSSARMVCSKVNEDEYLSTLPRSKSFTTGITLKTSNENLSPLIYTDNSRTEFRLARINNPITDYASDNRVNSPFSDPHSAVYVSNTINLKEVATSLRVYLSAYRHSSADIRVLYRLIKEGSSNVNQTFELFPGYDNVEFSNNEGFLVRDPSKNSGRPDTFVRSSAQNEFLEYQFSADNLGEFSGFVIKIVMSATNQAEYPRIKDLRALAVR